MSAIEDRVIARIQSRAALGLRKYDATMERTDLNTQEWLQHLQDELLDGAIYVERLKNELATQVRSANCKQ
jgi:hypothetical protein